jgi:hypothetical protein
VDSGGTFRPNADRRSAALKRSRSASRCCSASGAARQCVRRKPLAVAVVRVTTSRSKEGNRRVARTVIFRRQSSGHVRAALAAQSEEPARNLERLRSRTSRPEAIRQRLFHSRGLVSRRYPVRPCRTAFRQSIPRARLNACAKDSPHAPSPIGAMIS